MDQDPVQFILEGTLLYSGVLTNPRYTDVDLPLDKFAIAESKGDDVGVGIMIEVLLIHGQQKLVAYENVVEVNDRCSFGLRYLFNPGYGFSGIWEFEATPLTEEVNARHSRNQEFM